MDVHLVLFKIQRVYVRLVILLVGGVLVGLKVGALIVLTLLLVYFTTPVNVH